MEFREMRRKRQLLSEQETEAILLRGTSGTLALLGDGGYPYSVPISYAYDPAKKRILFHGAKSGHKVDSILREPKASFSVIDLDDVVPAEYTTYFRSAICFGTVRILSDADEIREAALILSKKYSSDFLQRFEEVMEKEAPFMAVGELRIEHMTGKEAIELVRAKEQK